MKGHVICTKCCKRTSICPTCASSTIVCIFCESISTDIAQHLNSMHNFNGPYYISSNINIEISVDSLDYTLSTSYKRIVDQEERLYALELKIKNDTLTASLHSFGKLQENIRYCIKDKSSKYLMMYFAKTTQEPFIANLKQVRSHFTYANTEGQNVFCIEVEFGEEFFYI